MHRRIRARGSAWVVRGLGLVTAVAGVAILVFAQSRGGWLGVALTGSDTSSNVLFGSLQKITAEQLGLNQLTENVTQGGVDLLNPGCR